MDTYQKRFWLALGILSALRLAFIGRFELSPDEAYYWTWSRHLDWAYYDQGPMLALVIRFFTWATNSSTEWSVRLGAVVLSFFTSWMSFNLLQRMFKSTQTAWYGFLALQASVLLAAGSILMMHDSIMVCFWVAALLSFYRALFEDWTPGFYLGALALGAGALAKYSMALFVPCLLIFLILSPEHRVWWKRPHLYVAGIITLVLVSPLLIWNATHGSASFGHIAGLGGMHKQVTFSLKTVGEYLGGQLGVMTPLLGALALAAPFVAWRFWKTKDEFSGSNLFLICFSAPVLLFFLALSFNTSVYANWPAPAYIAACGLAAHWVVRSQKSSDYLNKWFQAAWILGAVLVLLVHLEVGFGILPLTGKAASSVDRIRGWRAMGLETGKRWEALKAVGAGPVFLAARRYQIAAELSFYVPGQPEVQLIPFEKEATNQYRFWDHSEELAGQNALFVCEDGWEIEHLGSRFERLKELPVFQVPYRNRKLREIRFYQADQLFPPGAKTGFACRENWEQWL